MTFVLRDSIDAPLIPRDTPVVAGYGDGRFLWSPSWKASGDLFAGANWWDLFPASVQLVIVVSALDSGDILDVEKGDATPAEAPGWVTRFNRPRRRAATLYCDRNTWPAVIAALKAAGIDPAGPRVDWWIGTLDGTTEVTVPAGGKRPVAVQYVDTGAYDESVILDPSWVGLPGGDMGIGSAASDGDLVGIHHVMQLALFGVVDPSGQQAFIDAVRSGVDLNTIWDGWAAIPGAVAYGAALGRLVAVEGTVDHLAAAAPGADPAARQAALARLSLDAAAVVVDLVAAVNNAAPQAQVPPTGPTG